MLTDQGNEWLAQFQDAIQLGGMIPLWLGYVLCVLVAAVVITMSVRSHLRNKRFVEAQKDSQPHPMS